MPDISQKNLNRLVSKHTVCGIADGKYTIDVDLDAIINDLLAEDAPADKGSRQAQPPTRQS